MENKMSQILSTQQVIDKLEKEYGSKIWHICMVGEMGDIEGSDHKEIMIGVYYKENYNHIVKFLKDVVNVKDIIFTGIPTANFNQI